MKKKIKITSILLTLVFSLGFSCVTVRWHFSETYIARGKNICKNKDGKVYAVFHTDDKRNYYIKNPFTNNVYVSLFDLVSQSKKEIPIKEFHKLNCKKTN